MASNCTVAHHVSPSDNYYPCAYHHPLGDTQVHYGDQDQTHYTIFATVTNARGRLLATAGRFESLFKMEDHAGLFSRTSNRVAKEAKEGLKTAHQQDQSQYWSGFYKMETHEEQGF
ncbi:hypothetical protein F2P79_007007 [Pimephales promelas]|nr:hypothetical protein F2P79_007007 [Pimephales promelas]